MIQITLPDGSQRGYDHSVTVADVAASIGAGLAKAALGGKVDGKLVDTSYRIEGNAALSIVTAKDAEGLELIRHSTAHLLAYAVKELFPDAQVTIGPVIEHGFYYDFSYKRPFTPEDLTAIEKRMGELAAKDEAVVRRVLPRQDWSPHATVVPGMAEQAVRRRAAPAGVGRVDEVVVQKRRRVQQLEADTVALAHVQAGLAEQVGDLAAVERRKRQ